MLRDLYSGNLKWIFNAENIIQNSDNQEYLKDLEKIWKGENQEYKRFWGNVIGRDPSLWCESGKNKINNFSPKATQYPLCLCNSVVILSLLV